MNLKKKLVKVPLKIPLKCYVSVCIISMQQAYQVCISATFIHWLMCVSYPAHTSILCETYFKPCLTVCGKSLRSAESYCGQELYSCFKLLNWKKHTTNNTIQTGTNAVYWAIFNGSQTNWLHVGMQFILVARSSALSAPVLSLRRLRNRGWPHPNLLCHVLPLCKRGTTGKLCSREYYQINLHNTVEDFYLALNGGSWR